MLGRLFPRTADVGSQTLAWLAARHAHDRRLGEVSTFHLFRLPAETEEQLGRLLRQIGDTGLVTDSSPDAALSRLREIAGTTQIVPVRPGPVQSVTLQAFQRSEAALFNVAAHYLASAEQGVLVLPYFLNAAP